MKESALVSQHPSVGRVVHYVSYGTPGGEYTSQCRAAMVTAVDGPAVDPVTLQPTESTIVDLCVFTPTGQFFNQGCVQMEHARDGGTWHWPERA
jgi:hypothetical protein